MTLLTELCDAMAGDVLGMLSGGSGELGEPGFPDD
jgi:hypothetical protein